MYTEKDYTNIMSKVTRHIPTVEELKKIGFFSAPASSKYHYNYRGGLFDHSYNVTTALVNLTNRLDLKWGNVDSPYIIGMFHDLCKCDNYKLNDDIDNISKYCYNADTLFTGHGVKSVLILSQYLQLTEEEVACIVYHMGAFTKEDEWSLYTNAIHKYPNVLYTHTADMIAAHIIEK